MGPLSRSARIAAIVTTLARHVRPSLIESATLETALQDGDTEVGDATRFAADLEDLGPTFVKLGQMLSTRPDLLPASYLAALARLQDDVTPVAASDVRDAFAHEIGMSVDDAFAFFDDEPIASASLAQVHSAQLANGRAVVVKVRRPGIVDTIRTDVDALGSLADALELITDAGRRFAVASMMSDFRSTLVAELDFRDEADNLESFAHFFSGYSALSCPAPVRELTSRGVLTMDRVEGCKVTELGPLARTDIDGREAASQLLRAMLDQILVHGLVHVDPHPGNVLWADGRVHLIDFGMVIRLGPRVRRHVLDLVLALSEGRSDWIVDTSCELGTPLDDFDRHGFERRVNDLVGRFSVGSTEQLDAGRLLMELTRASSTCGLQPPVELTMVGKALLNLDGVLAALDPTITPQDVIESHVTQLLAHEVADGSSPVRAARVALSSARLVEELPGHVDRIVRDLAAGELSIRVDALDQEALLRSIERLATRVAAAVVVAAMIIGAAVALRVESTWTFGGQPAIALIFFVSAGVMGIGLGVQTILGGWWARRRRR